MAFSAESHRRAATAHASGRFDDEIVPVPTEAGLVTMDESVRPTTAPEVLAGLRPAFEDPAYADRFPQIDWSVTAGNSSPINDGAAALGHPLGASGARIMTTLVHEMRRRGVTYGLQTMCEAGGLANATIIEAL